MPPKGWLATREIYSFPISGAMGEGMGMGGNMGNPPACPPPPPPPCPPPPAAIPALVGSPPGAKPGSLWVDGAALHYVSSFGQEFQGTGTLLSTPPGAIPGSIYQEGSAGWQYVDASGVLRQLQFVDLGAAPPGAIAGSTWIESAQPSGRQLAWKGATNISQWWNGS